MKASIEALYDRISNITITDIKMKPSLWKKEKDDYLRFNYFESGL